MAGSRRPRPPSQRPRRLATQPWAHHPGTQQEPAENIVAAKQAGVSAVVGFVFGVIPSFAIRPLVEKGDLKLIIPTDFAITVFLGTVVLCLVASMVSFRKVASIDPSLVFRA